MQVSRKYICVCALSHSCVQLCDAIDCGPPGSSVRELFPSKSTGVGCHFLLQRFFPVQGSNTSALHTESSPLRHLGSPCFIIVTAFLSCPLLRFCFLLLLFIYIFCCGCMYIILQEWACWLNHFQESLKNTLSLIVLSINCL